jgi:hypothetical protein
MNNAFCYTLFVTTKTRNGSIYFMYYKVIYHTQLLTCMSVMKQNCNWWLLNIMTRHSDAMTADIYFGDISLSDLVKYSCPVIKMKFNADS